MAQGKVIDNVNILDIRKATPEAIAGIARIGNANLVLYSAETAGLLAKLNIGNLNLPVELPGDQKLDMKIGQTVFNRSYFETHSASSFPLVIGQLLIEPDVTAENIEKGFSGLILIGQVVCPEPALGALQSKAVQTIGQMKSYPVLKQFHPGSLVLDEANLAGMEDHSELVVLGSLSVPGILPGDLLEQKIQKIYVLEGLLCHEENAALLKGRLVAGSGQVKVIPAGFEWVEKPLTLNEILLGSLKTRKLYCKERVTIDPEISAAALDETLEALACEDFILCPAALKGSLAKKCDLLKNRVIFYEGTLWLVDGEQVLQASTFEALEGKMTLVVTGELTLSAEIDAKALAGGLAKVHNLGEIHCMPQQMGVIQARLGMQEGELIDSTPKAEHSPADDENHIGNANFMVL